MHPTLNRTFDAFLFDMDGTLINSIAAAERIWGKWAEKQGLDVAAFMPTMHGKRGQDTIRELGLDVDVDAEVAEITRQEMDDLDGIVAIEGIKDFLAALPTDRWAVVTSAPRALAERRLMAAGIVPPPILVSAEDVSRGKPNPDCFLLAAKKLGFAPENCLVFEDAPAGIQAGEASTGHVVVITATHDQPYATHHFSTVDYLGLAPNHGSEGRITLVQR